MPQPKSTTIPSPIPSPKLAILLPVRNESLNLKLMLKILRATLECNHETIVIYDDDNDTSIPVVQNLTQQYPELKMVKNDLGPGVVNAIRTGIRNANAKYVLIFAADEIGPVIAIEDMLSLMDRGCDLVSCTRYALGGRRLGGSFIGGILSRAANFLFQKITGSSLTDCTTGIKMFRKEVFESLKLVSEPVGWVVVFELSIKAQLAGLKLGEVPIISIDRLYGGKSSFRLNQWFWILPEMVLMGSLESSNKKKR